VPSPEYAAVIECVPTESEDVLHVAAPEESPTAEHPEMALAPSRKPTEPVGVPELPVTVAVKVTDCPSVEGFEEEPSETVAVAGAGAFTVCVSVVEVAAA
jgi:hypothetical protein